MTEARRNIRIVWPQVYIAGESTTVHRERPIILENYLLQRSKFDFEFEGRPAVIRVEERQDGHFRYGVEVTTWFTNIRGKAEAKTHSCVATTLTGAIGSIPTNVRQAIEHRRQVLDNA